MGREDDEFARRIGMGCVPAGCGVGRGAIGPSSAGRGSFRIVARTSSGGSVAEEDGTLKLRPSPSFATYGLRVRSIGCCAGIGFVSSIAQLLGIVAPPYGCRSRSIDDDIEFSEAASD